jgi:hypothetical protein
MQGRGDDSRAGLCAARNRPRRGLADASAHAGTGCSAWCRRWRLASALPDPPPTHPPTLQVKLTLEQFKSESKAASNKAKAVNHGMSDAELAELQRQMFQQARARRAAAAACQMGACLHGCLQRRRATPGLTTPFECVPGGAPPQPARCSPRALQPLGGRPGQQVARRPGARCSQVQAAPLLLPRR